MNITVSHQPNQPHTTPACTWLLLVLPGNKAIELKGVSYSTPTGKQLLDNLSFEFLPGERWGIAGRNGVGKSTVLDIIAGVKEPAAGVRDVGETAAIGYFTQYPPEVDGDLRMIDYIR
jgi:ATP-binding cassette subfamily F protein uup